MQVRLEADDEHRGFGAGGNDEDAIQGIGGREEHHRGTISRAEWGVVHSPTLCDLRDCDPTKDRYLGCFPDKFARDLPDVLVDPFRKW